MLRKAGTEPPWSSPLNELEEPGVLVCAGCETSLFRTSEKFESGSGWPSACSRLSSPRHASVPPLPSADPVPRAFRLLGARRRRGGRGAHRLQAGGPARGGALQPLALLWRGAHAPKPQPTFRPIPCAGCVQELRWPSGPPLLRRSDAHGPALLHQRRHAPARRVGLQPPTHRVAACCHCISSVSLGHSAARLSPPSLRPLRDLSAPFQHPNACTLCTRSAPALYPSVPALRPLCTRSAPISVLALQARARHGRATARCSCG